MPRYEQIQRQVLTVVGEAVRLSRTRGTRLGFGALAFAALTAVTYPIARYRTFTGYRFYDDEGYFLMFLKSFLDSGWHYDSETVYGPFYFEFWGAIYSIFGLPVNHNSSRMVTMALWILTSLIIGVATWRMTRNVVLGLATHLCVFAVLFSLAPDPMHPASLIAVFLAVIMALSCFVRVRTSPLPIALIGAVTMALVFVKINIGVFILAAVTLVCAVSYPALAQRLWLRLPVEVGFVALPLLLMRSQFGDTTARDYALHVCAAALAVVIALRVGTAGQRKSKELFWLAGGVLAVGVIAPLVVLATGTNVSELTRGVVGLPLSIGTVVLRLENLPKSSHLLDLLALATAFGYWYLTRKQRTRPNLAWISLNAVLSIIIGLFLAFPMIWTFALSTDYSTQYSPLFIRWALLAFSWVALIRPPGRPDGDTQFARLLVPPLAVLQALHAYPSAGGQIWWSTFLLVPVGALCVANGIRWIAAGQGSLRDEARSPLAIRAIAPAMVAAVLFSNVGIQLQRDLNQARSTYTTGVSLLLPGADEVHVSRQEATNLRAVVAAVKNNCPSFIMLPGNNSFYFWTKKDPPTGYWPMKNPLLIDFKRQQEMIDATRSIDGLCLLEYPSNFLWWPKKFGDVWSLPMLKYLNEQKFVLINDFGNYKLLKREGSAR